MDEIGRTFLVGCPRSGTTLLQSLLSAHPDVVSFPETFFFMRALPGRHRQRLGLASTDAAAALADLDALGVPPDPRRTILPPVFARQAVAVFLRRMDRAARDAGARMWLEKTPRHARRIARIQAAVPRARFVHLMRAGEAVVASLKEASDHDPKVWPPNTPLEAVGTWRRYVGYSLPYIGHPDHAFVSYERLVADTGAVMHPLCAFLGLSNDEAVVESLLTGYRSGSESVIGRLERGPTSTSVVTESWKRDVAGEITNRNDAKFNRLFDETERAEISAAVALERDALAGIPFL